LIAGGLFSFEGNLPSDLLQAISVLMMNGWPFALSLLAILAAHEFGHYFAGKRNNVQVTLPYFIPMPFSAFGTLGAFINMRSYPKNKKALFDLSITGPLCGFAVSVIVLVIGLKLSTLNVLPSAPAANASIQMEGNSLIYLLLKYLVFGKLLPSPHQLSGIPLFIYWGQYFFTGQPFPWGSLDVMLHPVAWAGWAGLFITGINLLPAGQLDGGHIFASAFGVQNARRLFPYILVAMVLMGFFWETWWIWAVLIFLMGRFYAEPLDQITPLDKKRKWLGWLAIVLFVITFIPVPLMII
jgi:membrane-associated protease RseP (regulator of RpoE activity)